MSMCSQLKYTLAANQLHSAAPPDAYGQSLAR
jgi:hypothetical protein